MAQEPGISDQGIRLAAIQTRQPGEQDTSRPTDAIRATAAMQMTRPADQERAREVLNGPSVGRTAQAAQGHRRSGAIRAAAFMQIERSEDHETNRPAAYLTPDRQHTLRVRHQAPQLTKHWLKPTIYSTRAQRAAFQQRKMRTLIQHSRRRA